MIAWGKFGPVLHLLSDTEKISVDSSDPGSDPPATMTSILPLFLSTLAQWGASLCEKRIRLGFHIHRPPFCLTVDDSAVFGWPIARCRSQRARRF